MIQEAKKISLYDRASEIIINNFAEKGWCIVDKTDFSEPAESLISGKTYLLLPFATKEDQINEVFDFLSENGIEDTLKEFKFNNGKISSKDNNLNCLSDLSKLYKRLSNISDLMYKFHTKNM